MVNFGQEYDNNPCSCFQADQKDGAFEVMKKYLFIVLLAGVCYSQKSYNEEHLVEQNGIWYKKFSDEVVNGEVFKKIGGMEAPLGKMKNGKKMVSG